MEDDIEPIEPAEPSASVSEPAPIESAAESMEETADQSQGDSGGHPRTDGIPLAAESTEPEVPPRSAGESTDEGNDVPHVEVVSPDRILPEAPGASSGARGGFTLPQNPTPTANELLLEQVFGKGSAQPADGRRAETPPIRIGIPSDSISESRKEGVIPRIVITVSLAHAHDMFERAVEEALKRAGPAIHAIARHEVETAAFRVKAEQRAADYRLRGPYFS